MHAEATRVKIHRSLIAAVTACILLAGTSAPFALAQDTTRKPITSANDLPRYTYPIDGAASALLTADAATFNVFGAKVGADIDTLLANYDIQDRATLRGILAVKLDLQVMSGTQDAAALQTVTQIRALEDKPDAKLISGLFTQALVGARADSGALAGDAYAADFQKRYAAALAPLPWSVVGNTYREAKSTDDIVTPALLIGQVQGSLDPAVAKTHELSGDAAYQIVRTRFFLTTILPVKMQAAAVLGALIAANTVVKPDIWAAREVTLHASDKLTPVRVGIWDSGSDVTLFPQQLYTDPHPAPLDGPHGLAYDLLNEPARGTLYPLPPDQRALYPSMVTLLEGFSDLSESIDSPAATVVKTKVKALQQADVATFFQNLELASIYSHGTHVTGIALRGNPAARLVVARITFDHKTIPTPPSDVLELRAAAAYKAYVSYFKTHHVRVVNMSWGGSQADDESVLEKNGIGKDSNERKALAAHYFGIDRAALYAALKSAPDILFICASGNANADSGFTDSIPSSFVLPNLLSVGAVDQAGDETSFTSYGKTTLVDADGYHVESTVPGGQRVKLSGTSMASPNVTNLAAKLLAVDPKLTPVQVIGLIRNGATATPDGRRHNIDERASLALLHKEMALAAR